MSNSKGNDYGQKPHYDLGDKVRVWPIFKNPIGTIEAVVDPESFPIKYLVRYDYFEGGTYTEKFDECDLTLYEKRLGAYTCNCRTGSEHHTTWCNQHNKLRW